MVNEVIQSMVNEGILVEQQFAQVQELKTSEHPKFVSEVLNDFCDGVERSITNLNNLRCEEQVNFDELVTGIYLLKGSSFSIGAIEFVKAIDDKDKESIGAIEFVKAIDDKDKERCLEALKKVTHEYLRIQYKLQSIIQLENKIYDIESKPLLHDGNCAAGPSHTKDI